MSLFKDSPKNQIIEFFFIDLGSILLPRIEYSYPCVDHQPSLTLQSTETSSDPFLIPLSPKVHCYGCFKAKYQTTRKRKEDSLFHSLMINMEHCQDLPNLPTVNQLILGITDSLDLLSKWSSLNFFNCFTFSTRLH